MTCNDWLLVKSKFQISPACCCCRLLRSVGAKSAREVDEFYASYVEGRPDSDLEQPIEFVFSSGKRCAYAVSSRGADERAQAPRLQLTSGFASIVVRRSRGQ